MEKVSDFFKELRDRVSNPILVSFTISWLVINWKVVFAIIFYSINSLHKLGYNNYYDIILKNYSKWEFIIHPLLLSIAYTVFMPIIKNGISIFYAYINTRGERYQLQVSGGGAVPISKYFSLVKDLESRSAQINEHYKKEAEIIKENTRLKNVAEEMKKGLAESKNEIESTQKKLESSFQEVSSRHKPEHLIGLWRYTMDMGLSTSYLVFKSDRVDVLSEKTEATLESWPILRYFYNPIKSEILFDIETGDGRFEFRLTYDITGNRLSGYRVDPGVKMMRGVNYQKVEFDRINTRQY